MRKNRGELMVLILTTDFTENTGNARIVSKNKIREFIRALRGIRGESTHGDHHS